jgi:hypothetical protein
MGTDLWRAHIHTGSSRLRSQSRYAKCKTLSFSPRRFAPVRLGFAKTSSGRDVCALMYTRSSSIAHGWIYQDTAALLEAVKMLGESEDKVERLWSNVDYLNKGFTALGFDIGTHVLEKTKLQTHLKTKTLPPFFCLLSAAGHSETPIIPVMLGDEDLAREFSARLFEEGVFASAIWYFYSRPLLSIFRFAKPGSGAVQSCVVFAKTRSCQPLLGAFLFSLCLFRFSRFSRKRFVLLGSFPMVPRGTARVRVIVSANFSKEDCDLGLAAFEKVAAELIEK